MSLETPNYTVLYRSGGIEYREYEPYLVSETVIENIERYNDAGNEGFRRLFRYITGANRRRAEIAMTAPVQQGLAGSEVARNEEIAMTAPVQQSDTPNGWTVSFVLPSQYSLETAPQPSDARVYIREVPARIVAVKRFSGCWRDANFAREERALAEAIQADGVSAVGRMERAAYNAPFTLPFMRRNEVLVAVDRVPAHAGLDRPLAAAGAPRAQ